MRHRFTVACYGWIIVALAAAMIGPPAGAQTAAQGSSEAKALDAAETIDLMVAGGGRQRALYLPANNARATVVMLPGGAGDLGIASNGDFAHDNNFLVRTRALWIAQGFAVLIPDAVDGMNLRGLRSKPSYADVIAELVAYARQRSPAPVVLIGTSQGSIAAMNAAAHLRRGEIAGVVLTESVSRLGGSGETVFDAHPDRVKVPVLIVANSDDSCDVAPPTDAPRIAAAMTGAPSVKVLTVSGGEQRSERSCGSLTPHGYYGIETSVVDSIAAWIRGLP